MARTVRPGMWVRLGMTGPTPSVRRIVTAAAAGTAIAVISVASSYSILTTRAAPSRALTVWPWNEDARAAQASALLQGDPAPATVAQAESLAKASLLALPLNVVASRAIGLAAALSGNMARAGAAMTYAESLSRRDLPTQLWFIEQRVAANDVPGALVHYDRALRTKTDAQDLLFPILLSASADPAVARPLARILAARPEWWRTFAEQLIGHNPSPSAIFLVMQGLRLNPSDSDERSLLSRAMDRLVDAKRVDLASGLLPAPFRDARAMPRNGGFETDADFKPFDWVLADEADLNAAMQSRDGGMGRALFVTARNGQSGDVARQVLSLAPGTYRLRATMGGTAIAAEAPTLAVQCVGGGAVLTKMEAAATAVAGTVVSTQFTVPAGCRGQWISVAGVATNDDVADMLPWIDDIAIVAGRA